MVFQKLGLFYRTIRHLKPIQLRYRLWYGLHDRLRKLAGHSYPFSIPREGQPLTLAEGIPSPVTRHRSSNTFTFLNQTHTFQETINWNINRYGKLWAYNLNYFDCLRQSGLSKEEGLDLIREFINGMEKNREGLEPYPISLRGMNWIRFISEHNLQEPEIDASLYAQYQILLDNLEYHLLGNHILENGCSLLFGAFYFNDDEMWESAGNIFEEELEEQVLPDGGHFERSVVYHSIILERLLDSYNLLIHNERFEGQQNLSDLIADKIGVMLSWLHNMQWQNGEVPEVNDHLPEMLTEIGQLFRYAERLGIQPGKNPLLDSGYRKYKGEDFEILVDVGNIGPDYVPGHSHSDIFSFLLRIYGEEVITDTGTSTYEADERRNVERSAFAHNTVTVSGYDQNEVWSAFRVGRRGHVKVLKDSKNVIQASHDGYSFLGVRHERHFEFDIETITIRDYLRGSRPVQGVFHLHFYPGIQLEKSEDGISGNRFRIICTGHSGIELLDFKKALGYHKLIGAPKAEVTFEKELKTEIQILET